MGMENSNAKIVIVNNTDADLRGMGFHSAIVAAIKSGGPLPEEISDLFAFEVVNVGDEIRGIINWA
jgi:hypothetical protein